MYLKKEIEPWTRFGKLTVLPGSHIRMGKNSQLALICVCDCGSIVPRFRLALIHGINKSCGCGFRISQHSGRKENTSNHVVRCVWDGIKARCYNRRNPHYMNYGGRGIKMCTRWRFNFKNFLNDMGKRPDGYTIERIDNDGDYEPKNCRWATRKDQVRNCRQSCFVNFNGKKVFLKDACLSSGLNYKSVHYRIRKLGWTPQEALTEKPRFNSRWHGEPHGY